MRAVEELVRRKLEKRAPDALSPKPDPYELRAPRGCSLLFPKQRKRRAINQGKLCCHKIQQASNFNGDWSSNTVSIGVKSTAQIFGLFDDQNTVS